MRNLEMAAKGLRTVRELLVCGTAIDIIWLEDDDFRYDSQAHTSQGPNQPNVVVFSEAGTSMMIPKKSKSGFMVSEHCGTSFDIDGCPAYASCSPPKFPN